MKLSFTRYPNYFCQPARACPTHACGSRDFPAINVQSIDKRLGLQHDRQVSAKQWQLCRPKKICLNQCVCDNFHAYVVLRPWTVVHQQDSPKCDTQQLQRSGSHLSALCMGLGNGFLKTGLDRFDHKSLLFLIYTRLCMYTIFSFRYIMFFCLQ